LTKNARLMAAALAWGAIVWTTAFVAIRIHGKRAFVAGTWDATLDRYVVAAPLARWDSYWYWRIADGGYESGDDGKMHTTAFFPLYPAVLGAIRKTTGIHPFLSGSAVSLAALLAAVLFIGRLAEEEGFDPRCALAALLLFPKAMFFAAVYTESLLHECSAACLLMLRRGRFGAAAAWGALAALARPTGVVLALPIAWAVFERRRGGGPGRKEIVYYWPAALAPIAGAACFGLYLRLHFGSALVGVRTETAGWGHRLLEWPWTPVVEAFRTPGHYWLSSLFLLAFALFGVLLWRRGLRVEAVYVVGSALFVLETWGIASAPRYMAVLFPVFFVIGDWMKRSPLIKWGYGIAGAATLLFETAKFSLGYWVS
jgi:hypothetical protein